MQVVMFIGVVFGALGVLFLGVGIIIDHYFKGKRKRASVTTTGTVVDIIREKGSRRRGEQRMDTYHPVYEYYANGEIRKVRSSVGSFPCSCELGDKIELHFNPEKPHEIFVETDLRILGVIKIIFCGLGGIFAILGVVLIKYAI